MNALSVRPCWAWLIINGHKDIENRDWKTYFRGRIFIHASQAMTRDEYAWAFTMAEEQGIKLPAFEDLERGGIVGSVEIVDCVTKDCSPWFFGDYGYVLKNAIALPFRPYKGAQRFFKVEEAA